MSELLFFSDKATVYKMKTCTLPDSKVSAMGEYLPELLELAHDKRCNMGLEWLYRLLKQPSRFWRMMALLKFGLTVLLKGKKFPQPTIEEEI